MRSVLGHLFCVEHAARPLAYIVPFNIHSDPMRFSPHFADEVIATQRD